MKEKNEEGYIAFFDFSSAYDKLDRNILKKLLQDKKILTDDQISLWQFLANKQ